MLGGVRGVMQGHEGGGVVRNVGMFRCMRLERSSEKEEVFWFLGRRVDGIFDVVG